MTEVETETLDLSYTRFEKGKSMTKCGFHLHKRASLVGNLSIVSKMRIPRLSLIRIGIGRRPDTPRPRLERTESEWLLLLMLKDKIPDSPF